MTLTNWLRLAGAAVLATMAMVVTHFWLAKHRFLGPVLVWLLCFIVIWLVVDETVIRVQTAICMAESRARERGGQDGFPTAP